MIIKIHKNTTENSTGRKTGVSVGIDVKKSTNPSGNVSLRLPLLSFTYRLFEDIKACLGAAVASSQSQCLIRWQILEQIRFTFTK